MPTSVYLEEITTPSGNTYWDVCQWSDEGQEVLASYAAYEGAMLHALSLDPPEIHRGKRTILDKIDIGGERDTVCFGALDILYTMRRIKLRE